VVVTSAYPGLRILGLCDYFSKDSSGGSERAALEVYTRMASRGATIRVLTTMLGSHHAVPFIDGVEVQVAGSIDLSGTLGIQAGLSPGMFRRVSAMVAEFKPDVIHAHTLFFQTSLAAAIAQRLTGLPLVTTVQIAGLEHLSQPARALGRTYEQTAGRFILSRSARVIAVSPSVRDHLLRLGTVPARITVIPNGVDLARFGILPRPVASDASPQVVFVGRLIGNKGPEKLLEALLELHREQVPFRACFYGDGPMRAELTARAKPAGAAIEFAGQVSDLAPRLGSAELLVRPSLTEGLPLALLEAMASGVCVIASDIPGNRDLVRDGVNGLLVPPRDHGRLKLAIRALLEDPARRARLAAAGAETARGYSWERVVDATAEVLTGERRVQEAA
jgi:glycosyltransferase involved in cell wall biosynthesis